MKFVVLASFLLVCGASTLFSGKNISVNDDGTIYITGHNGKRVVITRPMDMNGRKNIEITVSGPNTPTKRIEINDQNNFMNRNDPLDGAGSNNWNYGLEDDEELREKRGSMYKKGKYFSQGDLLTHIFKQYQGDNVDDVTYGKLLKQIEKAVQKGEIKDTVYDLLFENVEGLGGKYHRGNSLKHQMYGDNTHQFEKPWLNQYGDNVMDQIQRQQWLQNQMQYNNLGGRWRNQLVDEIAKDNLVKDIERRADLVGEISGQDINSQIQREKLVNDIVREKDIVDSINIKDMTLNWLNQDQYEGPCTGYSYHIGKCANPLMRALLPQSTDMFYGQNYNRGRAYQNDLLRQAILQQTVGQMGNMFYNTEGTLMGRPSFNQGFNSLGNVPSYRRFLYNTNQLVY